MHTKCTENNNIVNKMTTLYYIYQVLYFKGHMKMTSIHSIVNVKKKNNVVNKMTTLYYINLDIILHYITLNVYLYFKGHIKMTSIYSTINV